MSAVAQFPRRIQNTFGKRKDVCRVGVEVDEIVDEARREVLIE